MSVAPLEKPNTVIKDAAVVSRPRVHTRRVARPQRQVQPAPQLDVRVRVLERRKVSAAWTLRAVAFLGVFGLTYVASALLGQVEVESARRQEIAAKERAVEAARAESALSDKVFALSSSSYVENWATAHQFVAADGGEVKGLAKKPEGPQVDFKRYVASR